MGKTPLKCEICFNMTNGYDCKGHTLCAYCIPKYNNIPSYIPIGLWGKYVKIEKARRKARLVPFLQKK